MKTLTPLVTETELKDANAEIRIDPYMITDPQWIGFNSADEQEEAYLYAADDIGDDNIVFELNCKRADFSNFLSHSKKNISYWGVELNQIAYTIAKKRNDLKTSVIEQSIENVPNYFAADIACSINVDVSMLNNIIDTLLKVESNLISIIVNNSFGQPDIMKDIVAILETYNFKYGIDKTRENFIKILISKI